jgi:hypothetical protein
LFDSIGHYLDCLVQESLWNLPIGVLLRYAVSLEQLLTIPVKQGIDLILSNHILVLRDIAAFNVHRIQSMMITSNSLLIVAFPLVGLESLIHFEGFHDRLIWALKPRLA